MAIEKKAKGGAIMKWDEELAKHAVDEAAREIMPTGNFVSLKSGVLSVAGSPMKDNKLVAIIIDHVFENAYYSAEFDAENPQPPDCYAMARSDDALKPHEKVTEPQHEQCQGCSQNEFGTAARGKGKACKNTRRLALISSANLTPEAIGGAEIVYMRVPVTSVKGWAYYVKGLGATLRRPPFGVTTEIAVVPDKKDQFKVVFNVVDPLPDAAVAAVMQRREQVMQDIMFPYGDPKPVELKARGKPATKRKF